MGIKRLSQNLKSRSIYNGMLSLLCDSKLLKLHRPQQFWVDKVTLGWSDVDDCDGFQCDCGEMANTPYTGMNSQ